MFARLLLATAAVVTCANAGFASPIVNFANTPGGLYNTGVAGSAYTISGPGLLPGGIPAVTGTAGLFPVSNYTGGPSGVTTPTSQWILTQANDGSTITNAAGIFNFTTTFTLPSNLQSALVNGRFVADDGVTGIVLNGANVTVGGPGAFSSGFQTFSLNSGFNPGLNTLTFRVSNDTQSSGNPVALNVQIQSATAIVPEPATLAVFGFGLAGIGAYVRRRKAAPTVA